MLIRSLFISFSVTNVMILCMNTNSDYEAPWRKPGYKLAMESNGMKPYVYRPRFPRKVYYSEKSKGDSSLKAQERLPRSDSLIQPQLINFGENFELPHVNEVNSLGIKSRLEKRKQLRRVAKNDVEIQILDMDPLQLKEALILGLRELAKRQATDYSAVSGLFHDDVPADLSVISSFTDNKHEEKLIGSSEDTQTELAKASSYTNEKHEDKLIEVSEDEPNYLSKSSLNTDDKNEEKLMEGSEGILNNLSETPLFTNEKHEEKLIEDSESILAGLSNPSLYSNDKHEDKLIESSESLRAELAKTPFFANVKHEDKLIDSSEIHKGLGNIEFQIEPNNKKDEEYMDETNYKDIVNVYQEKLALNTLESKIQAHPKRNTRVKSYQDSFDEPPMLEVKTLSEGRNLELSNFLTPDKNSINSIDSQNSFNVVEESRIIDISKGDYISEDNRIEDDDSVIHKSSRKFAHDDAQPDSIKKSPESQESIDDFLTEEKSSEHSKEDENQKDKTNTDFITDSSTESKNSENSNKDNQKDKNDDSIDSNHLDSGKIDKEKMETKTSKESNESSSESDESSEGVNPVEMKPLPQCPDYMDLSYRVDKHKGVICSSDEDCKEEGEFCCQAYSNLNKCSSNLSSDAMDVTPPE